MKHEAQNTRHEARILVMAGMVAGAAVALAMPTQQELKKVQPMVAELMAPTMDDFKAKKKTAAEVADMAVKYAGEAETEAAKFMLYRSSIPYYVRGEAYDKAADAVTLLKTNVKNVPAEVIAEIISKATVRANREKAPRLFELYQQARTQATAERDVKELRKKPASPANRRKLAEALAMAGKWSEALKEFANLKDKTAQIARKEQDGSGKSYELGEFWWAYEPAYDNAEETFKVHAAVHYRKALAAGEITGLKKNIVEQRIKEYGDVTEVAVVKSSEPKRLTYSGYLPRVNTQLWDGVSVDDIQSFEATFAGRTVGQSGRATGYVVKSGKGWKFVQFQYVDGVEHLKCVYARFEQKGGTVRGYVEKAMFASSSIAIGTDFATIESAQEMPALALADDQGGYGIKDLVVTVGGKSAAAIPAAATTTTGSIELKTGDDSPFTVKGNEATLELKNGAKLEFVKCPAGKYKMGFTESKSCLKYHSVAISRPFWMAKLPMTYKLRDGILGKMKRDDGEKGQPAFRLDVLGGDNAPAAITYNQALDVLKRLNQKCQAYLPGGYVLRMPSEAEYEYAAKSGRSEYNVKTDGAGEITLFQDRLRALQEKGFEAIKWDIFPWRVPYFAVGSKKANDWGLYDMFTAGWSYTLDSVNCKRETDTEALTPYYVDDSVDPVQIESGDGKLLLGVVAGCGWGYYDAKYQGRSWVKFLIERGDARHDDCFLRIVIGPDLVSEWKAKNGKK